MSDFVTFAIGFLAGLLLGALAFGEVNQENLNAFKIEAVKHGAAEWIVDDAGNTTFQWKTKQ